MGLKEELLRSIKQDFCRFALMSDYGMPDPMDPVKFTSKLAEKIASYKRVLTPGTDEYEKAEMMEGYSSFVLFQWKHGIIPDFDKKRLEDIEGLYKVLASAEPIKMRKNGYMLYFDTLVYLTFQHRAMGNYETAQKHAKEAEELYDAYRATNSEVPTHLTEFQGSDEISFDQYEFEMMRYQIAFTNWQSYVEKHQSTCPVKYPIGAVKWMLHMVKRSYDDGVIQPETTFEPLYEMINLLIQRHCFKQVDNALAAAWSYSIKCRQNLPPNNRHTMDNYQGLLASLFAQWCCGIWKVSLEAMKGLPYILDNDSFIDASWPREEDYKAFLGQLPFEPAKDHAALNNIYKKGLAWKKRADKMCKEPGVLRMLDLDFKEVQESLQNNLNVD